MKVVIPEGSTRLEIARIAAHDGLTGNYLDASRSSPLLSPGAYGAPSGTPDLEGFLFPATYEIYAGDSVARLVEDQLVAFSEKVGHSLDARAQALHLTPYQLLTIASLIEREAVIPGDRPKIAAVILNRLAVGVPIGDRRLHLLRPRGGPRRAGPHGRTDGGGPADRLPLQHPHPQRPAADADLQPGARVAAARPPTPPTSPYMYYVAGADGCGEQCSRHSGPVRSRRRRLPGRRGRQRRAAPGVQAQVSVRLGVLGWPVAHSRSPAMQNAALAELGPGRVALPAPAGPTRVVRGDRRALPAAGFLGANVTIPHKQAALALATRASDYAREIGAANTLTFTAEGEIAADNTDAPGVLEALGVSPRGMRAQVLGAGGSARAVVWALLRAGAAEVWVWNRTPERAGALAGELGGTAVEHPRAADLLVNCTAVGAPAAGARTGGGRPMRLSNPRPPGTQYSTKSG